MIVYDADGAVVGRLAAQVAKKSLAGEEVAVVNVEKAVITGSSPRIYEKFRDRRNIQQKSNPEESVKWPRRPDLLFKRILKGMLPKKKARGRVAFKLVKAHLGVPKEFAALPKEKWGVKPIRGSKTTLLNLCEQLGWESKGLLKGGTVA